MRRLAAAGVAASTGAAAAALAGCGGGAPDSSTVARPVAPDAGPPAGRSRDHGDTPPRGSRAILGAADRAGLRRLIRTLGGEAGLAVSATGIGQPVQRLGTLRRGVAWSTAKVPIAMAVIDAGQAEAQAGDLQRAIAVSDNDAARRLWADLGGGRTAAAAAQRELRRAGDAGTTVEWRSLRGSTFTPFGQTDWALDDQVRFTAAMPCSASGRAVLRLMADVAPGQRWGLGAAGVPARFKGGWGPGSAPGRPGGYLDRQMGIVTIGGRPVAVALASRPADGSHASGASALTAMARWLVRHADTTGLSPEPAC